jgi:DNA-binding MarR family transcriptional regulator
VSAFQELFDLIGELARRRHQNAERSYAAMGLNHTEARLLMGLRKEGGAASQDVLANQLSVDRTNAGRALQRLEDGGYIQRRKDEQDKRAKQVEMTAKGKKVVTEIGKLRVKMAESFFGDMKEGEAETAVALLRKALPRSN